MLLLLTCYTRVLKLFNLTLPHAEKGDLMQLLEDYKPSRYQSLRLLHQRIEVGTDTGVGWVHVMGCLQGKLCPCHGVFRVGWVHVMRCSQGRPGPCHGVFTG